MRGLLAALLICLWGGAALAAEASGAWPAPPAEGSPFAFGQSSGRGDPLWTRGEEGGSIGRSSVAPEAGAQRGEKAIEEALAAARRQQQGESARLSGSYGLKVRKEDSTWHEDPVHERSPEADEGLNLESRHVLGAYAGMKAGEDLSISVGPELILKDDRKKMDNIVSSDGPDSALGLGMQFKLDF